ncbi:MAG TPA: periplasmic heavy metal sensor, partial [Armatimonadota bacterium]
MRSRLVFGAALLALVAVLVAGLGVYAQRPGGQPGGQAMMGPMRLFDGLDLTVGQRDAITRIVKDYRAKVGPLYMEQMGNKHNLVQAIFNDHRDMKKIESLRTKTDQLNVKIANLGMNRLVEIANVLNSGQRAKFREKIASMPMTGMPMMGGMKGMQGMKGMKGPGMGGMKGMQGMKGMKGPGM